MPGGGLMQLVAFGAQDVYLTGDPKVTFFQSQYKRHTNFAMECVQQTLSGSGGNSGLYSVTLARTGDLVGDMFLSLTPSVTDASNLTSTNSGVDMAWVAERAINSIDLYIGGQLIDKHYQTWFRLYAEVFLNDTKKNNYGRLSSWANYQNPGTSSGRVILPLIFFFNRNPGLYLPLIALQYHEVRIDLNLTSYYSDYFGTNVPEVWANYMYLDTAERERFAKNNHEYLIEQVQHITGDPVGTSSENAPSVIRLAYNHPVKELIWCYQNSNPVTNRNAMWNFSTSVSNVNVTVDPSILGSSYTAFATNHTGAPVLYTPGPFYSNLTVTATTATGIISGTAFPGTAALVAGSSIAVRSNVLYGNAFWIEAGLPYQGVANTKAGYETGPLHKFKLMLNGTDRFNEQLGKYFNQYQPYQYHTGYPYPGVYVYSFGLKPEELQPSGACNFSRIDMAQVAVSLKTGAPSGLLQKMFAVNYNVLRIQSGMGGLAFSN
jgi:hypothetical protein